MPFYPCTAEMGGGERGKEAWARRWQEKIRLPIPEKYPRGDCGLGYFFGYRTMALAILHNVIIGLFSVGIAAYKRGGKVL